MTSHAEEQVKTWERHLSTITSALVILILGWMGSSIVSMGNDISVIKVKVGNTLDIKNTLSAIQHEHAELGNAVIRIKDRVSRIELEQANEDIRERKEHGTMR